MKKTHSKTKPIKTGKEIVKTYCLGCKDCTDNFKPQEVKMTKKVLREKSKCPLCQSSKSRFLHQKKKKKIIIIQQQHKLSVFCERI